MNKPYIRKNDENGTCIDIFPYNSGVSDRQIRRGNEKLDVNTLGQVIRLKRTKSAKRKTNWH